MTSVALRALGLAVAVVALAPSAAHAQARRPRADTAESAHAQRDGELAAATGLTQAQAATVFQQIQRAPHAPRIHSVVAETRPDGARHVFGLMDVDGLTECRLDGYLTARECRPHTSSATFVFFTQLAPDGRITRTGYDLPFGSQMLGARSQRHRPVALRLFAPSAGAPAIAVIDGVAVDRGGGGLPPSYDHALWIWNGRHGRDLGVSRVSRPVEFAESLGAVTIDEAGHGLVLASVQCRDGCRCEMPGSLEAEASALARVVAGRARGCSVSQRPLDLPPGSALVADDLDARAPRRPRDQARAARAGELARASGVTPAQAGAVVALLPELPDAPRFTRFLTHVAADRSVHVYGVVERLEIERCVYERSASTVYDAVRACAHEDATWTYLLYAGIAPDGTVSGARMGMLGTAPVIALHLVDDQGAGAVAVESAGAVEQAGGDLWYTHEVRYFRAGAPSGSDTASRVGSSSTAQMRGDLVIGEIVATPVRGARVSLAQRGAACSRACPCEPVPSTLTEARRVLASRASTRDAACQIREQALGGLR